MKKYNQRGMSSILFAMIFTIILSLLAVGFASLVRNDQRQTLDQSLGYQAQYAAETAVNQVKSKIKESASPLAASPACGSPYEIITSTGVRVSCVTWDNKAKSLIYEQVGIEPVAMPINVPSGFNKLRITWTTTNKSYYGSFANISDMPNGLSGNNYPVIRFTYLPNGGTNSKQQYFVPSSNGSGQINYLSVGADGNLGAADCDTSKCVMDVITASFPNGYLAIAALGQIASSVTIEALQGTTAQDMLNAQYTIDATAIAQDVTKRVQARVPYGKQTWRPGFAASADAMCKDIRIDGTNANTVSGAPVATCP